MRRRMKRGRGPNAGWGLQARRERLNNRQARIEDFPVFDTHRFDVGAVSVQNIQMYSVPLGNTGNGFVAPKTSADTSMDNAGRLSDEVLFVASRMGVKIQLDAAAVTAGANVMDDVRNLEQNIALRFTQPGFDRLYGTLDNYPAGGGIYTDLAGVVPGPGGMAIGNGVPAYGAMRKLNEVLRLGKGQTFAFRLEVTRAFNLLYPWRIQHIMIGVAERQVVQG